MPGSTPLTRHDELTRRRLRDGALAGLLATLLMTALLCAAPSLSGRDAAEASERLCALARAHAPAFALGLVLHFGYGALAGALFAIIHPGATVGSGISYGLLLWAVAVTVYSPLCGLGFLARAEPALAAMVLPAHLLYGAVLGALTPRGEIVQPLSW
jgi:hypothetical protein